MTSFAKHLLLACMTIVVASSLTGCGKKGKLEAPDGSTYPRQYPKAEPAKPQ